MSNREQTHDRAAGARRSRETGAGDGRSGDLRDSPMLANQPGEDETSARALLLQVQGRDYNPPRRERILEWQSQQDFPICPTPEDPNSCNVYSELRFPEGIYDNINEFYQEQAEA